MRLLPLAALIALPLLAACSDSSDQAPAETPAAVEAPAAPEAEPEAQTPAATPAAFPDAARPLLGTWAVDLADCGTAASVVTVTEASIDGAGYSCDMALTADGDGYSTACGGEQLKLTPVFAPSGEGINIDGPDGRQTVLRCSR